jgi:hypothetical protein
MADFRQRRLHSFGEVRLGLPILLWPQFDPGQEASQWQDHPDEAGA